jgi:hypothetical protein
MNMLRLANPGRQFEVEDLLFELVTGAAASCQNKFE